jgi:hypothetical protein
MLGVYIPLKWLKNKLFLSVSLSPTHMWLRHKRAEGIGVILVSILTLTLVLSQSIFLCCGRKYIQVNEAYRDDMQEFDPVGTFSQGH